MHHGQLRPWSVAISGYEVMAADTTAAGVSLLHTRARARAHTCMSILWMPGDTCMGMLWMPGVGYWC